MSRAFPQPITPIRAFKGLRAVCTGGLAQLDLAQILRTDRLEKLTELGGNS